MHPAVDHASRDEHNLDSTLDQTRIALVDPVHSAAALEEGRPARRLKLRWRP